VLAIVFTDFRAAWTSRLSFRYAQISIRVKVPKGRRDQTGAVYVLIPVLSRQATIIEPASCNKAVLQAALIANLFIAFRAAWTRFTEDLSFRYAQISIRVEVLKGSAISR